MTHTITETHFHHWEATSRDLTASLAAERLLQILKSQHFSQSTERLNNQLSKSIMQPCFTERQQTDVMLLSGTCSCTACIQKHHLLHNKYPSFAQFLSFFSLPPFKISISSYWPMDDCCSSIHHTLKMNLYVYFPPTRS